MNKTKLVLRSLLLMLILWAVNAIALRWPVHIATKRSAEPHPRYLFKETIGNATIGDKKNMPLRVERGNVRVRNVPVE